MPRTARSTPGGYVYHVLNRAVARLKLFRKPADYEAFLNVAEEALEKHPIRVLAYCVMPTHWHFVLWPERDQQLTNFLRWMTLTHSVRWHKHHHSTGSGHVYQNRFKAFAVQDDEHLFTVLRYVERNPLRANLVQRAELWRWSSLYQRQSDSNQPLLLSPWPVLEPPNWVEEVNAVQTEAELAAVRRCVERGCPYGSESWVNGVVARLGLHSTTRPRGRPRKANKIDASPF